jgi:glyoxylase-like metal-dependent hydrolase (beta-lactamase superfamily II)
MKTIIHTYTSVEPMLKVNAFIVEADKELVIVDTTLTMTDSKALKQKADSLGKPVAGIILTHGHPDHVAGTYNISPDGNIPVYALKYSSISSIERSLDAGSIILTMTKSKRRLFFTLSNPIVIISLAITS